MSVNRLFLLLVIPTFMIITFTSESAAYRRKGRLIKTRSGCDEDDLTVPEILAGLSNSFWWHMETDEKFQVAVRDILQPNMVKKIKRVAQRGPGKKMLKILEQANLYNPVQFAKSVKKVKKALPKNSRAAPSGWKFFASMANYFVRPQRSIVRAVQNHVLFQDLMSKGEPFLDNMDKMANTNAFKNIDKVFELKFFDIEAIMSGIKTYLGSNSDEEESGEPNEGEAAGENEGEGENEGGEEQVVVEEDGGEDEEDDEEEDGGEGEEEVDAQLRANYRLMRRNKKRKSHRGKRKMKRGMIGRRFSICGFRKLGPAEQRRFLLNIFFQRVKTDKRFAAVLSRLYTNKAVSSIREIANHKQGRKIMRLLEKVNFINMKKLKTQIKRVRKMLPKSNKSKPSAWSFVKDVFRYVYPEHTIKGRVKARGIGLIKNFFKTLFSAKKVIKKAVRILSHCPGYKILRRILSKMGVDLDSVLEITLLSIHKKITGNTSDIESAENSADSGESEGSANNIP